MRRRRLKAMLEKAELRMFEGAWRVARQQERIAEMSRRGVDMRPYWEVLAQFEETQRLHMEHVQRIKKDLYDPSEPKGQSHPADVNAAPSREPRSIAGLTGEERGDEAALSPPAEASAKGGDADADRSDGSFHHPHDQR
jgi:hypothetical protein